MNVNLTRNEIEKLYKFTIEHSNIDFFTLVQTNNSGIGLNTKIQARYIPNINSDITDYSAW